MSNVPNILFLTEFIQYKYWHHFEFALQIHSNVQCLVFVLIERVYVLGF